MLGKRETSLHFLFISKIVEIFINRKFLTHLNLILIEGFPVKLLDNLIYERPICSLSSFSFSIVGT